MSSPMKVLAIRAGLLNCCSPDDVNKSVDNGCKPYDCTPATTEGIDIILASRAGKTTRRTKRTSSTQRASSSAQRRSSTSRGAGHPTIENKLKNRYGKGLDLDENNYNGEKRKGNSEHDVEELDLEGNLVAIPSAATVPRKIILTQASSLEMSSLAMDGPVRQRSVSELVRAGVTEIDAEDPKLRHVVAMTEETSEQVGQEDKPENSVQGNSARANSTHGNSVRGSASHSSRKTANKTTQKTRDQSDIEAPSDSKPETWDDEADIGDPCREACLGASCVMLLIVIASFVAVGTFFLKSTFEKSSNDNPSAIPSAPDFLPLACSVVSIGYAEGRYNCERACSSASCCWDSRLPAADQCSTEKACKDYEHCANLVMEHDNGGHQDKVPTPPSAFASCSSSSTGAELAACKETCNSASCCWMDVNKLPSDRAPCDISYSSECAPYQKCEDIDLATSSPTAAPVNPTLSTTTTNNDQPFDVIFGACLNHNNILNKAQKSVCEEVCSRGSCCFQKPLFSSHSVCHNEDGPVSCALYEPCRVLYPEVMTEAGVACTEDGDRNQCIQVCAEATCCFVTEPSQMCFMTNPDIVCRDYEACEVLYNLVGSETNPAANESKDNVNS